MEIARPPAVAVRIRVQVQGQLVEALIDSGAAVSVLNPEKFGNVCSWHEELVQSVLLTASGERVITLGTASVRLHFVDNDLVLSHPIKLVNSFSEKLILGADFLKKNSAVINFGMKPTQLKMQGLFFNCIETVSNQPSLVQEQFIATITDSVVIPPMETVLVDADVDANCSGAWFFGQYRDQDQEPLEGLQVMSGTYLAQDGKCQIAVSNSNLHAVDLNCGEAIAVASPVEPDEQTDQHILETDHDVRNEDEEEKRVFKVGFHLSEPQRLEFQRIINMPRIFYAKGKEFHVTKLLSHSIDLLQGAKPVHTPAYRASIIEREALRAILKGLLEEGIIEPSTSPWSSPTLLVKKPDGSWRLVLDFRRLNAITIPDRYPTAC